MENKSEPENDWEDDKTDMNDEYLQDAPIFKWLNQGVKVDITTHDLIIVDEDDVLPYVRPWIALLIDTNLRSIVGYQLYFKKPFETKGGIHGS